MMLTFLVRLVLMVLTLLVVVPAATGGAVAVRRGGFCRGFFSLLVIGLCNCCLWLGFGLFTLGGAVVLNYLLFGLIGLCINALAFKLAARLMPDVLYVASFGSAFWASVILTLVSFFINHLVIR
ncbi:MAG: phage holin family protein [Candidatus Obscuribacterales bacterium]|nr:phage holin family protein [Candidatus Obscuribacterales bacterium]